MGAEERILPEVSSVRAMVRERLLRMTGMTEREVLAAGRGLNDVVNRAREHVDLTRGVLEAAAGGRPGAADRSGSRSGEAALAQSEAMTEFLSEMSGHLAAQLEHAASAHANSTEIRSAAKSIAALSQAAHFLALNAKIETAKIAHGAGVFSAISTEMQSLSTEVQRANAQIAELGANLVVAIPQVSALAFRMEALTEEFSNRLTESLHLVREEERRMRESIMQALQTGDQILAEVVARAGDSLSHLQFQDSTAQGLLEIDRWLFDLEGRIAACLEVEVNPVSPLHMTIGGSSDYDPSNAGELTLL
jgi:hypothetical protein